MKKQYINLKGCLMFATCLVAMEVGAQGFSPAALEQLKAQRLWMKSQNAAGTAFDDVQNYSDVKFNYDLEKGNFIRPLDAQKNSTIGVSSEGFINLGNAYLWGSFSFEQENLTDGGHNVSITDPYRGMPYYCIDEHQRDWRNQFYNLKFRAATPVLKDHWTLGIEGTYIASLAAKQRDPRIDTRFYTLELMPGVTYKFNDNHKLGLSFRYTSIKEDSREANENNFIANYYYELYGLGTAIKGVSNYGTYTTNYYGDRFGGALQYNLSTDAWNVLLEGSYSVKAETAEKTYSEPELIGSVKDKLTEASLNAVRQGDSFNHYISANYQNRHIDGYQYIMKYDDSGSFLGWMELHRNIRSTYKTTAASFDYAISKNMGAEYSWKAELGVDYMKQEDEYLMPNAKKSYENVTVNLCFKKNFVLSDKMNRRLLLDVHGAYNNNMDGAVAYSEDFIKSNGDHTVVKDLEKKLQEYYTSDYMRIGGSLTYSQQVKEDAKVNMFAKFAFDRMNNKSDYKFDNRSYMTVSLGCNF